MCYHFDHPETTPNRPAPVFLARNRQEVWVYRDGFIPLQPLLAFPLLADVLSCLVWDSWDPLPAVVESTGDENGADYLVTLLLTVSLCRGVPRLCSVLLSCPVVPLLCLCYFAICSPCVQEGCWPLQLPVIDKT